MSTVGLLFQLLGPVFSDQCPEIDSTYVHKDVCSYNN